MSLQKVLIALVAIIMVLALVLVGVAITRIRSEAPVAAAPATVTPGTAGSGSGSAGQSGTGMPAAPFDAAKATKVVGTPKAHVEKYFDSIIKGDYATAFKLLPVEKQAQGQQAFAGQVKSYGMKKFTIDSDKVSGDTETIEATVTTMGGDFSYAWEFVKVKGAWLLKSRTLSGMGG